MNVHHGKKWFEFMKACDNRDLWVGDATTIEDTSMLYTRVLVCASGTPPSYILLREQEVMERNADQLAELVRERYRVDVMRMAVTKAVA